MPLFSDTEFSDISTRPCLVCAGFSRLGNDADTNHIFNIIFTKTIHFILQSVCIICLVNEIERKVKTKKGD